MLMFDNAFDNSGLINNEITIILFSSTCCFTIDEEICLNSVIVELFITLLPTLK